MTITYKKKNLWHIADSGVNLRTPNEPVTRTMLVLVNAVVTCLDPP